MWCSEEWEGGLEVERAVISCNPYEIYLFESFSWWKELSEHIAVGLSHRVLRLRIKPYVVSIRCSA